MASNGKGVSRLSKGKVQICLHQIVERTEIWSVTGDAPIYVRYSINLRLISGRTKLLISLSTQCSVLYSSFPRKVEGGKKKGRKEVRGGSRGDRDGIRQPQGRFKPGTR